MPTNLYNKKAANAAFLLITANRKRSFAALFAKH